MKDSAVLIVILNWQQPTLTLACIEAVQKMKTVPFDILLIDNGSKDNSVAIFDKELPHITRINLPENLGFAGGCNTGLRHATDKGYDYALLLNNDAFPDSPMLENLMAEIGPDVGLVSPKILYHLEPEIINFGGGSQHPRLLEVRDPAANQKDGPQWQATKEVDYLWGTCWLVNLSTLPEVGLLDEQFFMYYEDLDWSIRFRQKGYRLLWVGKAKLYHQESRSTGGTDSPLRRYYLARSSIIFFRRYAHLGRPLQIFFYRLASALKMTSRLLFKRKPASAAAYLRGIKDGWQLSSKQKKSAGSHNNL